MLEPKTWKWNFLNICPVIRCRRRRLLLLLLFNGWQFKAVLARKFGRIGISSHSFLRLRNSFTGAVKVWSASERPTDCDTSFDTGTTKLWQSGRYKKSIDRAPAQWKGRRRTDEELLLLEEGQKVVDYNHQEQKRGQLLAKWVDMRPFVLLPLSQPSHSFPRVVVKWSDGWRWASIPLSSST